MKNFKDGRKQKEKKPKWIFWKSLIRPYRYCLRRSSDTFIWSMFTLIGGLFGVFFNIIQRCLFGNLNWSQAIYADSVSGNFYTYALVLVSAVLGPIFISLLNQKNISFKKIKIIFIVLSIFMIVFCAVFYSIQSMMNFSSDIITEKEYALDIPQLVFFILSFILALYSLGLQFVEEDKDNNEDIDTPYYKNEEDNLKELDNSNPTITPEGISM